MIRVIFISLGGVSPTSGTTGNARAYLVRPKNAGPRYRTQGNRKWEGRDNPDAQRSGLDSVSRSNSYNNFVRPTLHLGQSYRSGFFVAVSEHPVHLRQLQTRAGEVEKNPGPHWCNICDRNATSNSIKSTWCELRNHKKRSGLTKTDIQQIAEC